jgi:hypothetical protein
MLQLTVDYTRTIEQGVYQLQLLLNNTRYFWNASEALSTTLVGVNAELTYDTSLWLHNILQYIVLALVLGATGVIVASIFFEKWIGLELMQTFQAVYFIFSLADGFPFEWSPLTEYLKYSNGFDDLLSSDYTEIYPLPNSLIALSKDKEFLFNFNLTFLLVFLALVTLSVLAIIRFRYRLKLEEAISMEVRKKL